MDNSFEIDWIPKGKPAEFAGWMNGPARGIQLILEFLGEDYTYESIAASLGVPFLIQGEENSTNLINGAVDVGWWPLEITELYTTGITEKLISHKIQKLFLNSCGFDNSKIKESLFDHTINSLRDSKPCLIRTSSSWYIITKYDGKSFYGMCPNEIAGEEQISKIDDIDTIYACVLIGSKIDHSPKKLLDIDILEHAVDLYNDDVFPDIKGIGSTWVSGYKVYDSWINILSDTEKPGEDYWHKNIVSHLYWNRQTAIKYISSLRLQYNNISNSLYDNIINSYQYMCELIKSISITKDLLKSNMDISNIIKTIIEIKKHEFEAITNIKKLIIDMKGTN